MKQKFKLKSMAAAVALSTMAMGSAKADSLLAPLIISDLVGTGFETIISLKIRGNGVQNNNFATVSPVNYTYLRKGFNLGHMFNLNRECTHENGPGTMSPWDMNTHTVEPLVDVLAKTPGTDQSVAFTPASWAFGAPFYGMAVIDDLDSVATTGNVEGNSSGFGYVINYVTGSMFDYKLLNNHKSTAQGDFSVGFTRKTSVDLSWNPLFRTPTIWLGVATGDDMTNGSAWDGSIRISQDTNTALGNITPTVPHAAPGPIPVNKTGVYNNDELNISGDNPVNITCMGLFTYPDFMNATQLVNTVFNGGWTRKSIIGDGVRSTGGMVYKAELHLIPSIISNSGVVSFQPETSGHLSAVGPRPNRPY